MVTKDVTSVVVEGRRNASWVVLRFEQRRGQINRIEIPVNAAPDLAIAMMRGVQNILGGNPEPTPEERPTGWEKIDLKDFDDEPVKVPESPPSRQGA